MKRAIFFLLLVVFLFPVKAFAVQNLVGAEWLVTEHSKKEVVKVIDIRSVASYEQGHIPHSVSAPYGKFGWRTEVDGIIGKLPTVEALAEKIEQLGIENEHHVVIVPIGKTVSDIGSGARVYWTFKFLGHKKVSLLDGGYGSWEKLQAIEEKGVFTAEKAAVKYETDVQAEFLVTTEQIKSEKGLRLIDSRGDDQHNGYTKHPKARVGGTLEGAERLPHFEVIDSTTLKFKSRDEIVEAAQRYGWDAHGEKNVTFCNTGHWAATSWFALSEVADIPTSMYDGSWVEWSANSGNSVENKKNGIQLFIYNLIN